MSTGLKLEMLLKQKLTIIRLQVEMDYWVPMKPPLDNNFICRGSNFCIISSFQSEQSINQTVKYFPNTYLP
jgi:hypothetical protein